MCVRPVRLRSTQERQQTVPCGQCVECRLRYARHWAVRLMHEASLHEENCFATLTYDGEHVPGDGGLRVGDFQRFLKRTRLHFEPRRVRFFHCGEYGEEMGRPHYHAILFGVDFADKVPRAVRGGNQVWASGALDSLWGNGLTELGSVTFESAQYVARYVMKKVRGRGAAEHYGGRAPEYVTMSRRPGIGAGWYERYSEEVERLGTVAMRGAELLPPRFYDERLRARDEGAFEAMKRERVVRSARYVSERELRAREAILEAKVNLRPRS